MALSLLRMYLLYRRDLLLASLKTCLALLDTTSIREKLLPARLTTVSTQPLRRLLVAVWCFLGARCTENRQLTGVWTYSYLRCVELEAGSW